MKVFAALVLLVCVVYVTSQACFDGTDCDDMECCLKVNRHDTPRCSGRLPRSAACIQREIVENGTYWYGCPCVTGLSCQMGLCFFNT